MSRTRNPDLVGWYVDIPKELADEFSRRFPQRGAKKALTVGAITHALAVLPDNVEELYDAVARWRALEIARGQGNKEEHGTVDSASEECSTEH